MDERKTMTNRCRAAFAATATATGDLFSDYAIALQLSVVLQMHRWL